jgi:hypothetical protein
VVAFFLYFGLFFGILIYDGSIAGEERHRFEQRATPVTGEIIGRYIANCAKDPCTYFPADEAIVKQPDLIASQQYHYDNCAGRNADGSKKLRSRDDSLGWGPCTFIMVTAYLANRTELLDYEAVSEGFYWDNWDQMSLPLLIDPKQPTDARIKDSRYDLRELDFILILIVLLVCVFCFDWIKARTWTPWREAVKLRKEKLRRT